MPGLATLEAAPVTKLLLLGNSGSGKTGALASLAGAGYNLRIMDFDGGLEILANVIRSGRYGPPSEVASRVSFVNLVDSREKRSVPLLGKGNTVVGQQTRMVSKGDAWQRAVSLLEHWKTETEDFGSIYTWTPKDIWVIDSFTYLGEVALSFVLKINNRTQLNEYDYGAAQALLREVLSMIRDRNINCNVIVTSHIKWSSDPIGILRGLPQAPGKALDAYVATNFNSTLQCVGEKGKEHKILTQTNGTIELKTSAPDQVKPEYPLATGLAEYFRDLRGSEQKK